MIRLLSPGASCSRTSRDVPFSIIAGEQRITQGGIFGSFESHWGEAGQRSYVVDVVGDGDVPQVEGIVVADARADGFVHHVDVLLASRGRPDLTLKSFMLCLASWLR